jgi:hypothetical protein
VQVGASNLAVFQCESLSGPIGFDVLHEFCPYVVLVLRFGGRQANDEECWRYPALSTYLSR